MYIKQQAGLEILHLVCKQIFVFLFAAIGSGFKKFLKVLLIPPEHTAVFRFDEPVQFFL